jgi:hypothetical protein
METEGLLPCSQEHSNSTTILVMWLSDYLKLALQLSFHFRHDD